MIIEAVRERERPVLMVLAGWAVLWFAVMAVHGGGSWHFFVQGANALADVDDEIRGGLHLYAAAPVLQIGPVALLAALALLPAGPAVALLGWQVLGAAAGVLVLWLVRLLTLRERPDLDRAQVNLRIALAGLFLMPVWMYLAVGAAHLDDVLALVCTVIALCLARLRRPWLTGVLLGVAVDAKPWALAFAALILLLGERRLVVRAAVALVLVVAAAWLPFFVADPSTTNAMRFTIPNTRLSALRAFGVNDPQTPPWDRPAQLGLGLALGILAIRRGRWPAIVLLAIGARLLLDPGTNRYYIAGLVIGTLVWDAIGSRWHLPWWTAAASLGLFVSRWVPMPPATHGWLTVAFVAACCTLLIRSRTTANPYVPFRS